MPRKKRLRERDKAYIAATAVNIRSGGKKTRKEIAKECGFSETMANNVGSQIEKKLLQVPEFKIALEATLPIHKILNTINDCLSAEITRFFQHEGFVTETKTCVDNRTRLSAAEFAARLHGLVKPPEVVPESKSQFQLNILLHQGVSK